MAQPTIICPKCGRSEPAESDFCYCGHIFVKSAPGTLSYASPQAAIPQQSLPAEPRKPLVHQLARASVAAPLVAGFVSAFVPKPDEDRSAGLLLVIVFFGPVIFGLIAAIIALVSIRRHGTRGLLIPGLLGLLINGAIIASVVYRLAMPIGPAAPNEWQSYTSVDGRCTVLLPAKGLTEKLMTVDQPGGLAIENSNGLRLGILWQKVDGPPPDEDALAQIVEAAVRSDVELLESRPIQLQGRPARELKLGIPPPDGPAIQLVRIGFFGNRRYQLTAQIPAGQEQAQVAVVARFFDSFTVVGLSDEK